ncbi:MAG: tripartite tricarboxylate transporter substrate binding protein [Hyphomicrobiales bacterium]|nr:tripartite tricarboxylate transporter substrate binding protein [Hyphomicrobiales bacterium]
MSRLFAALIAAILAAAPVAAQDWPSRPVRMIVPFGAGGTSDVLARVVADHLSASLKQQFVVENRTGAGGMIGVQALASSAPDGYTIGITNVSTLSLIPVINPKNSYHPLNDFVHIAFVAGAPVALAVYPKLGVRTLAEFVAYANKSDRPLTFASSGLGSDGHIIGEAIAASTKIKVEHVPYKATGQALTDVAGGHVVFSTFTLSSSSAFIRAGTLMGLAVTSAERMPDYPDLPTFKELGYPNLVSSTWFSISGPAKLPSEIAARLNREINAAMAKAEVQDRMRRDGLLTDPMTPAAFTAFVAAEGARWAPLIQRAGLAGKGP